MSGYRIQDPFFKQLYKRLDEELQNRVHVISSGGSKVSNASGMLVDVANTALKYSADVSYIQALQLVIDLGLEIDKQIYGSTQSEHGDD